MTSESLLDTKPAAAPGAEAAHPAFPVQVIEPARGRTWINWAELWRYRELLYFLTWRDVKVRYKQTVLGAAWAILQPFMTMVVFSIFFGKLAGLGSRTGGVPYPIYVYAGLLPWTFFANAVANSSSSLVGSANLVSKVYFPRLVIPFSSIGAALLDFAVSSIVLLLMMGYYRTPLSPQLALVPLLLLGTVLAAGAVGTYFSALTVAYRDFRYVVPFLVQLWMFATPVIYPSTIVPERWRWVLALNPMAGLIEGFRSGFLARPIEWGPIGISLVVSAAAFFGAAVYFRTVERRFADII